MARDLEHIIGDKLLEPINEASRDDFLERFEDAFPRTRKQALEEWSTDLAPRYRSMLVISLNRPVPAEIDEAWLLSVLPAGGPREQVEAAALVVVTDPQARLAKVAKNIADPGEYLEMHTAAIG